MGVGGCNNGSHHVAGKCMIRYPIWYTQPVAQNMCTVGGGGGGGVGRSPCIFY